MPHCGGTVRNLSRQTTENPHTAGSVSWKQARPGNQSVAQLDDKGNITLTATGPGPKNEEGALKICARLVRMLNAGGGSWTTPVNGDQDVDGLSIDREGGDGKLQMQVVRASNNEEFWGKLNRDGCVGVDVDAKKIADELMAVIDKKAAKYPLEQRKNLALLLDAGWLPSHTFQPGFESFRKLHLEKCTSSGFAQVWAVGPTDGLVVRLDQ